MTTKEQQKEKCRASGRWSKSDVYLYKLSEMEKLGGEERFWGLNEATIDHYRSEGQIYHPDGNHSWEVNIGWLEGVFEARRNVIIYSPLKVEYLYRKSGNVFSAFAREIAGLIKAGYEVGIMENNMIQLSPSNSMTSIQEVTPAEIHSLLNKVFRLLLGLVHDNLQKQLGDDVAKIEDFLQFLGQDPDDALIEYLTCNDNMEKILKSDGTEDFLAIIGGIQKFGLIYGDCSSLGVNKRYLEMPIKKFLETQKKATQEVSKMELN